MDGFRAKQIGRLSASAFLAAVLAMSLLPIGIQVAWASGADDGSLDGEAVCDVESILVVLDEDGTNQQDTLLFQPQAQNPALDELAEEGITVEEVISFDAGDTGAVLEMAVPESLSLEDALALANATEGVAYAQPNFTYYLDEQDDVLLAAQSYDARMLPNDAYANIATAYSAIPNQYYLYSAGFPQAWDRVTCNGAVTVAVIDSGVRLDHLDLQDNLRLDLAYDAYNSKSLTAAAANGGDPDGHGTHVAGIVAATANNQIMFAGGSYNAQVIPIKAAGDVSSSKFSTTSLVRAYTYLFGLVDSGKVDNLRVINMSLGSYEASKEDELLHSLIVRARQEYGILTVCAGGNDGSATEVSQPHYPSDFDECLAVTALDTSGHNVSWSDHNQYKDISAPGQYIWSTCNQGTDDITWKNGTSMASPLVAAAAALCWAYDPAASVDQVINALEDSATEIIDRTYDWRQTSGSHGALNIDKALANLQGVVLEADSPQVAVGNTTALRLRYVHAQQAAGSFVQYQVVSGGQHCRLQPDGTLVALTPGVVEISVTAQVEGEEGDTFVDVATLALEVIDASFEGSLQASANENDYITISWKEQNSAPAASLSRPIAYQILRSATLQGEYALIATVSADGSAYTYNDAEVISGVPYAYKIQPVVDVEGQQHAGLPSAPVMGCADVAAVHLAAVDDGVQRYLLNRSQKAQKSNRALQINTVVLVPQDDPQAALGASGLAGALDALLLPVDFAHVERAQSLLQALQPTELLVFCPQSAANTTEASSAPSAVEECLLAALPAATVQMCAWSTYAQMGEITCDLMLNRGCLSVDGPAFLASDALPAEDAAILSAYAYAKGIPVFFTENAALCTKTLINIGAHAKTLTVIGDEEAVPAAALSRITQIYTAVKIDRVELSAEPLSQAIAERGVAEGLFSGEDFAFALSRAGEYAGFFTSWLGDAHCPLLLLEEDSADSADEAIKDDVAAETLDFIASLNTQDSAQQLFFIDCPTGIGEDIQQALVEGLLGSGDNPVDVTALFPDLVGKEDTWYMQATIGDENMIAWAVRNGIVSGVKSKDQTLFVPNGTVTRAMVVTMLHRAAGEPLASSPSTLSDVDQNRWYANAVNWACQAKVVNGYPDGTFCPDKPVTRQELAVMITNYADYLGLDVDGTINAADITLAIWQDGAGVAAWASRSVTYLCAIGSMGGAPKLNPKGTATRAETTKMICVFLYDHAL